MAYPAFEGVIQGMQDSVFNTMSTSGKYDKTPRFAADMKREIQQVVEKEKAANTAAQHRYITAHTAAIGSVVEMALPRPPSSLAKLFKDATDKWLASKQAGLVEDGKKVCGGKANTFHACTDAASPCCNINTQMCGSDVESCTCVGQFGVQCALG